MLVFRFFRFITDLSLFYLICLPATGCLKTFLKHVTLSEWHLSAACFLFLDFLKQIDLNSFFDCGNRDLYWIHLKWFLRKCCDLPAKIFFGSVSCENNPCTTECIFSDLVESILKACWRKVLFSYELLPDESCLGELVGATLLSGPALLRKFIIRLPILFFVVEGPGEKAVISLYSSTWTTLLTFDGF